MNDADHYLLMTISSPDDVFPWRWSPGFDAIEDGDGRTLAVYEEVKLVLEGVFSTDVRPPFVCVVTFLDWCRRMDAPSERDASEVWQRLHPLVVAARPTPRSVGLLFAFVCAAVPRPVMVPTWDELNQTLERRRMFGDRVTEDRVFGPPVTQVAFAKLVNERLQNLTNRQLVGLLVTGESDPPDPEPVAQVLLTFPERLAAALAEFRSRDRLVGAAFLAPLIDGALALPPRRPTPDRLPQGGYADVTTRGIPDRLLPSQFALDADEFVRRFAENELLYFRREEPHAAKTPTRVLLLDQGVRTWGPVRLGLAGAAVAVLTRDPARFAAVSVGVTSCESFLDPWALSPSDLATHLEASDLSAHPADLLERALRKPAVGPRDIVLLTHPRNARELSVRETLLDLPAADRLFLLTLDDAGEAELLEVDERGQRSVRRFRVDLTAAAAVKVAAKIAPPARALPTWAVQPWTGDIEAVPFPFRAGLVADVDRFITFDADATWVVVLGRDGALHAKRVNSDEPLEVLPRPVWAGRLLGQVQALLPMRDGFALVASTTTVSSVQITQGWESQASAKEPTVGLVELVAAHYDFTTRRVRCMHLGSCGESPNFLSIPERNCVALKWKGPGNCCQVLVGDFDAPEATLASESHPAHQQALTALANPLTLDTSTPARGPSLDKFVGGLSMHIPGRASLHFDPTAEGKPIFKYATLINGVLAADALAVVATEGKASNLWVLNAKDGAILHQQSNVTSNHALTLSPDGRWLARQTTVGRTVEVRGVNGGAVERLPNGGYHTAVVFHLAADCLRVRVGRYNHCFWLDRVPFTAGPVGPKDLGTNTIATRFERVPTAYDAKRFETPVEAGPWVAAYDRWGQIVLMALAGELVMHVCVCRGQWAVVLPDGTRCGSASLLGGAPTPDAERLIGEALRDAARR